MYGISGQLAEFISMPFNLLSGELYDIEENYFKFKYGYTGNWGSESL